GMRHATDPDHVIAVSTIVSREREIGKSAWIGVFWGIGHTLTIFAVGAAIILFDVAISPRLGLSMELAVGLMLILLGVINVVSFFRGMPSASERAGAPAPPQEEIIHSHAHSPGDLIHTHTHSHGPEAHVHAEGN